MRNIRLMTIALTGTMLAFATSTYAQNPFLIDGVVTDAANSKASGNADKVTDPSGATKELGPKNGSPQQLGDIHTAAVVMLSDTNPNGNNDLNTVYTKTEQTADGHTWLYYGWARDTAGTGIIGIELQQEDADCDYANLLACNPWKNRSDGDVAFVWDTKGGALVIVKRIFREVNGAVVLPPCPQNFPTVDSPECKEVAVAAAKFSSDSLRGEAAIDLTAEGIVPLNQCTTFSNVIPFSGTGNSDSADIKDAVLNDFPPITNCGVIMVKKVLLNLTSLTGEFNYKVDRASGDVRPGELDVTGTLTHHNHEVEIADLTPGTNYRLAETSASSPFVKVRIFCTLGTGQNATTYTLFDATPNPAVIVTAFPVQGGATTYCTIENKAVGSPQGATVQSGRLHDQLQLSNVLSHAALSMTATFSLWTSSDCTTGQLATGPNGATEISSSVTFVAKPEGEVTTGVANTLGTVGFGVTGSNTYYWLVKFSGDSVNPGNGNGVCHENTVITFNDN